MKFIKYLREFFNVSAASKPPNYLLIVTREISQNWPIGRENKNHKFLNRRSSEKIAKIINRRGKYHEIHQPIAGKYSEIR